MVCRIESITGAFETRMPALGGSLAPAGPRIALEAALAHERTAVRFWTDISKTEDAQDAEAAGDQGKELVREVTHVEGEDVGEKIGHLVLGESIMRNVIPVVGVVSSAITNVVLTRKMGNTVRRYFRYQRAFGDTFSQAIELLHGETRDLLIEGIWFIFTADGKLAEDLKAKGWICVSIDVPRGERS